MTEASLFLYGNASFVSDVVFVANSDGTLEVYLKTQDQQMQRFLSKDKAQELLKFLQANIKND